VRVLVSGAGGFLGRSVVDQLLKHGHEVRAIVRQTSTDIAWTEKVELFRADLRTHQLIAAFANIDAVIHVAAATSGSEDVQFSSSVVGTERFLDAMAQSTVKRLVHVSSFVVYDWSRAVSVLDEETPLLTDIYNMGGYTIAKVWQERIVREVAAAHGWDLTIMRPGFIWGPEHAEIAGMGRRLGRTYVMFGPFTRLPLSHVTNCAHSLVTALESRAAIGETFNVVDGDDIRVWRYVREHARRTGQQAILLPVPYFVGSLTSSIASWASRLLFGGKGKLPSLLIPRRFESQFKPIRFSNQKLGTKLAWSPPLSFDACLDATYRSEQA